MYKKITYPVLTVLLCIMTSNAICAEFMRGADISMQTRQDADGITFNEYGVPKDVLTIFKNHDLNWIRIRIFNDPSGSPDYGVCQDLAYVTTLGARVKAQGFKFLLDFHYSDTWADPGKQYTPAAWVGLTHSQLVTAVHDYTRDVIAHLRTNGAMPDMVQIGNEITCGMLWPDGQLYGGSGSWGNFVDLINAGIAGVNDGRGSAPMPKIMLQIDRGGDAAGTQWFLDNILSRGVVFDVIGQSYYPEWHGTLDDLQECLNFMAANYSQDIVIAEAGDYYTGIAGKTPESQKKYLEEVIQRVQATPGGKGIGVFYWEPTWVWNSGVGYRALFEPTDETWTNFNMLMGMEAFDIKTPYSNTIHIDWAQKYNGTANSNDYAMDIATDSNGNAYVTGYAKNVGTNYDFVTIKYAPDGNAVWTKTYNRHDTSVDSATAISIDANSNVIVAGYSRTTASYYDGAVVKYNSAGTQLWAKTFNYSGKSDDEFFDVAVDAGGNVYAVGISNGNCLIIKYTPEGNMAWWRTYNGTGNSYDALYKLGIDSSGNIYVCGETAGAGTGQDCLTMKYSPDGTLLWADTYNGSANRWDLLEAIALDSAGNVYVTGSVETAGDSDYVTIKYSPAGSRLWTAFYTETSWGWDESCAIAVDPNGNVVVTGYSEGATSADAATVKYNAATGEQIWAARYNGAGDSTDYTEAIAIDNVGNIYVHGRSFESGSTDYLTICYDSNGAQKWLINYDGYAELTDVGMAIAVVDDSNIYVTGCSMNSTNTYDYATVKYTFQNKQGQVDTSARYQVLEGFGAANVWSGMTLVNHPQKSTLYNILFGQLGLDILRLRNTYQIDNGYIDRSADIVAGAESSLGHPIKVMISSWSPPASLKSNNSTVSGTLKKDLSGNYMYTQFAQWWADSLTEYGNHGIPVEYASMQNEPDWQANWDTCRFYPTESSSYAGYKQAFQAFYTKLNTMPNRPKILAPEGAGMTGSAGYIAEFNDIDKSNIYGWAHHLYNWGDLGNVDNPDGYIPVMADFAADYNDKPRMQTEFSRGDLNALTFTDAMNLAILMHNALTYEQASAYLYWELTWGAPKGLVSITSTTYTINPVYYAFKHYSAFTDPNWQRIEASTDSDVLRISAYISPNNRKMSIVIINTAEFDVTLNLPISGFDVESGSIYRTSRTENCIRVGAFDVNTPLTLPARSITTVALTKKIIPPVNCQQVQDFDYRLSADLNSDCYVDFADLQIMTENWLAASPIDIPPPGHSPDIHSDSDSIINLLDFAELAAQWLICNDPQGTGCISNWLDE